MLLKTRNKSNLTVENEGQNLTLKDFTAVFGTKFAWNQTIYYTKGQGLVTNHTLVNMLNNRAIPSSNL